MAARRLRLPPSRLRAAAALLIILAGLASVAVLGAEARRQFDGLRTTGLDSVQWTASQLEVDLLRLSVELARAEGAADRPLDQVRQRFDIFYSRVQIVSRGAPYRELLSQDAVTADIAQVATFLERTVPLIDGPDPELRAALPAILDDVEALHPVVRRTLLRTVDIFAQDADAARRELAALLARIAMLGAATFIVMGAMVLGLLHLQRQQRRAEEELRKARDAALAGQRAKSAFIAVMSHEMRTPLNGTLAALDLAAARAATGEQAGLIGLARDSAEHLLDLLNDILDISRIESGRLDLRPVPIALAGFLEQIVSTTRPLAEAAGNRLLLTVDPALPPTIRADPLRLRQVLQNLLSNGIKFTRGGTVHLRAAQAPDGGIDLAIEDSGIGIAAADQTRIFDDFVMLDPSYERTAPGSGLGLGICRRLVQAMGGQITLDSLPGRGSVFTVRLPPGPDAAGEVGEAAPAALSAPPPEAQGRSLRVLVVEDNGTNRLILARMLEDCGHRATLARDGLEGIAAAGTQAFDAILMDVSMPGMDGVTATGLIRAGGGPSAGAPIFALTAQTMPDELARFRAADMRTDLLKPVRLATLRAVLAGLAPQAQGAPGPAEEALFDAAIRAEQGAALGAGGLAEVEAQFVADADRLMSDLRHAAAEGASARLRESAHELRGAAASLGLTLLTRALREVEARAEPGGRDLAEAVAGAEAAWQRTRRVLAAEAVS